MLAAIVLMALTKLLGSVTSCLMAPLTTMVALEPEETLGDRCTMLLSEAEAVMIRSSDILDSCKSEKVATLLFMFQDSILFSCDVSELLQFSSSGSTMPTMSGVSF